MKVFEISGKLFVKGDLSHQEMLNILYELTKHYNIKFIGESKDVSGEYVQSEEYIRVY